MMAAIALLAVVMGTLAPAPAVHTQAAHRVPAQSQTFKQIAAEAAKAWSEGRDEDALRLSRDGLKRQPGWDDGLWYLGTINYAREDFGEARNELRHYLARNPQKGIGWALVGLCDYKLREYEHASDDLHRALELGLQGRQELAGPVYYYSALLFTRDERFEESAAYLYHLRRNDAGLRVDAPLDLPMGLNALRYAMLPEETPADRVELVRQAGAAVFARYEERRDDAKRILVQLLKQYPNEQGLHFQYGLVLLDEHAAEGVTEMGKVIELSPSNPEPHLSIAQYYIDQGQKDKASASVDGALALDPKLPLAHLLKGEILSASGDLSGAIAELESARSSAPTNSRVLWELMRIYGKAGRKEDAVQIMKELEKLGANSDPR